MTGAKGDTLMQTTSHQASGGTVSAPARRRHRAFTLIERLVVIAIIALIEANIPGHRCLALAYPMGAGNYAIASDYFIAARGTSGVPGAASGMDYMNTSIGSGQEDAVNAVLGRPVTGVKWLASPNFRRGWLQPLSHGANDMRPGATPATGALKTRGEIENLARNRDQIWIELFVTVAKYAQERDSATLRTVTSEAGAIQLSLTDLMKDNVFDQPLTLKVRLPDAWTSVKATQGGSAIPASMVTHEGKPFALVEGIPDRGNIALTSQ